MNPRVQKALACSVSILALTAGCAEAPQATTPWSGVVQGAAAPTTATLSELGAEDSPPGAAIVELPGSASAETWTRESVAELLSESRRAGLRLILRLAPGESPAALAARPGVTLHDTIPGDEVDPRPLVSISVAASADAALSEALVSEGLGDALDLDAPLEPLQSAPVQPNDTYYRYQWALARSGAGAIGAPQAWAQGTDGSGVIVAVLDTGATRGLRDLEQNLLPGWDATTGRARSGDYQGHGTSVCGVIGARGDDRSGITGVRWSARILPIDVFGRSAGASQFALVRGLRYAVQQGAKVINMSLGGPGGSRSVLSELRRASQAGVIVVAAAGNESRSNDARPSYPANYDVATLISVGATRRDGRFARLSNYGRSVDIAAPGERVVALDRRGGARYINGTSFSAPFVSGALALIWSDDPRRSASTVLRALLEGASPRSALGSWVSGGRMLDLEGARERLQQL